MSIEHGKDISELFRRINNLVRVGKVVSVDYGKAKAKVKIGDNITDYLPWLTPSTCAWIPLQNGEQVVVLSPNGDLRFGMILPALYQAGKPAPSSNNAQISIVADIAQTGSKTMSGDLTTQANITATGEVQGKGINLSTHTHEVKYIGAGTGSSNQTTTSEKPS